MVGKEGKQQINNKSKKDENVRNKVIKEWKKLKNEATKETDIKMDKESESTRKNGS
jgi:hypothetical protein